VELEEKDAKERLKVINVCPPTIYAEKQEFWDKLLALQSSNWNKMRIFGGYFNTAMYSTECMGGNIIRYPFREWLEGLLSNSDLVDIKPHNWKYTGSNQYGFLFSSC